MQFVLISPYGVPLSTILTFEANDGSTQSNQQVKITHQTYMNRIFTSYFNKKKKGFIFKQLISLTGGFQMSLIGYHHDEENSFIKYLSDR